MTVTNNTDVLAYAGAMGRGTRLFNGTLAPISSDTTSGILLDLDMAWTMSKQQVAVVNPDGVSDPWLDTDNRGVVAKNQLTGEYMYTGAIVGDGFTFTQNEPIVDALRQLQDAGILTLNLGGSLDNHTKCFVHATIGEEYRINDDPHMRGVLFRWAHDGSAALSVRPMVTRMFCLNQIKAYGGDRAAWFSIRHTKSAEVKMAELQGVVIAAIAQLDEYDKAMERLMDIKIRDYEFDRYVETLVPIESKLLNSPYDLLSTGQKRSLTMAANKRDAIRSVYYDSPTQENLRGTAAGAFHAAVEAYDWRFTGDRGKRLLTGQDDDFKARAQHLALAL